MTEPKVKFVDKTIENELRSNMQFELFIKFQKLVVIPISSTGAG